ncbi:hypothetical protein NCS52_01181700 [Fusarium sp. LHS14.1]|nr:hypothetical protein NCS52_01181700 [Fusarium sp. LHS14.1]
MDPAIRAQFVESPLYRDLKTAFQHIIQKRIKYSQDVQQNEVLEPYYYITGLPLPFNGGCWCIGAPQDQCPDPETCPCRPRPFMGVNMRLAVCNQDNDERGNCFGARRDCFDPRNVAEPYFSLILSRGSEPDTPWSQQQKDRLTSIFGLYTIPDGMYNHFVNAACALVDDMIDPFRAGNAGWVSQVHGILGWYGQSGHHCVEELVRCMRDACRDRLVLESLRPERARRRRNREDWEGRDIE